MAASYDANKGAKCARETRAELGIPPDEPVCVLSVVEGLVGIPVAVIDLDDFAGAYIDWRGRRFIFIRQSDSITRKRFSLAHELGHHRLCHPPVIETWDAIYADDRPPTERQANAFAAEFMAPKAGILRWLEEHHSPSITLDVVCRLSARFGLSAQATLYRLESVRVSLDPPLKARLEAEIKAGDHERLVAYLGLDYPDCGLARAHGHGPRLPEGDRAGMLGALLRGDTDVGEAAELLGQDPAHLEKVIEDAGIPAKKPA
jgi:Zn-dependent peptidase ImmA (M78 family)